MIKSNEPPPNWSFGFSLSSEHVWSAFLLYCLLEDAMERQEYLVVAHTGDHKDRFTELVQARNQRIRIEGQPELTHFCDKCTRWFYGPDGKGESVLSLNRSGILMNICSRQQMFSCSHGWNLHWPSMLWITQLSSAAEE